MSSLDTCTNTHGLSCYESSRQHAADAFQEERRQERKKRRLGQIDDNDTQSVNQAPTAPRTLSSDLVSANANSGTISLSLQKPVLSSSGALSFLIHHNGGIAQSSIQTPCDIAAITSLDMGENCMYSCLPSAWSESILIAPTKTLSIPLLLDAAQATQPDLLPQIRLLTRALLYAATLHLGIALLETSLIVSVFTRPATWMLMLPVVWSLCLSLHSFCWARYPSSRIGCVSWLLSASAHMLLCFTVVLICVSSWGSSILWNEYGHTAVTIVSLSVAVMSIMTTSLVLHRYVAIDTTVEVHQCQQPITLGSKFGYFRAFLTERFHQRHLRRQKIQQHRVKKTYDEIV